MIVQLTNEISTQIKSSGVLVVQELVPAVQKSVFNSLHFSGLVEVFVENMPGAMN